MAVNVSHNFWVDGEPPVLNMANNKDDWYIETFTGWSEVESFIETMRAEAEKAFGPVTVLIDAQAALDAAVAAERERCQRVCRSMSFEFNAGSREQDALQRVATRFDMPDFRA